MGLLELLQQGQTQLSAGSFPGDAPINDPQSGFVQDNSIYNSYENETIGQPFNGSKLISTFDNTALDITNYNQTTDIDAPTWDWATNYPALVSGKFNGAPNVYELMYNSNGTYLDDVPIQTPNSPQLSTLNQTGLDIIDTNAEPTTIVPNSISYPNNYPALVSGEFKGAPSPYETIYNFDNTYLTNVPIKSPSSFQLPTLNRTSLDNTDQGSESTTDPAPSANSYPNYWPSVSPQTNMGRFGYQPNQFYPIYFPGNGYYSQFNYEDAISTSGNTLVEYVPQSGLSPNNNETAAFIQSYPFNQTYLGNPGFPPFVTGRFNREPDLFQGEYDVDNIYLDDVPIKSSNSPQRYTLDNTGLDNTNNNADETTFTPNSTTAPNDYPEIEGVSLGALNGAPNDYQSIYNPNNTYLENVSDDVNSIDENILGQTGLDIGNMSSAQTTVIPDNLTYPNNYPALVSGEFNGAPSQYETPYNSINTYLNNVPIQNVTSPQLNTLSETGLDNTNLSNAPTTTAPFTLTTYPAIPYVSLGQFNGGPSQYESTYNPNNTYLDAYNTITNDNTNPLNGNLNSSGLDNTYPFEAAPTAEIPSDNTSYPVFSSGKWQGAPQLFTQKYGPSTNQYYPPFVTTLNTDILSQQYDSLSQTGLDIDNVDAAPTTDVVVNPDNITVYPASNVTGVTGSAPQYFNQVWKPVKRYYNDYAKPLKDENLA